MLDPNKKDQPAPRQSAPAASNGAMTPQALAAARAEAALARKFDRTRYETVRTPERLAAWIARAHDRGIVAIAIETASLDPMQATLCGFSLALGPDDACYVPLAHRKSGGSADGLFGSDLAEGQIAEGAALAALKPLLEDKSILKVGENLKIAWLVLAQRGIEMTGDDDTMLMSYALDAGRADHRLEALSERYLDHKIGRLFRADRLR